MSEMIKKLICDDKSAQSPQEVVVKQIQGWQSKKQFWVLARRDEMREHPASLDLAI